MIPKTLFVRGKVGQGCVQHIVQIALILQHERRNEMRHGRHDRHEWSMLGCQTMESRYGTCRSERSRCPKQFEEYNRGFCDHEW